MEKEKVLGYILLFTGILMIFYSAYSVYQVFTNNTQPYELFTFNSISIDLSKAIDLPLTTKGNASQELISSELLNKPMNILFHVVLMGFLVTVGFRIASIGTTLVRPIKVNLKEAEPAAEAKNANTPPWKS